jgi:CRP/FNR family transcriptional regulator
VTVSDPESPRVTFVLAGAVRVFHRLPDGREYTPKILEAPNHFGDVQPLAGLEVHVQSVEIVRDAELGLVPWAVVRDVLRNDHACALAWLSGIASQFVYAIDSDRHNALADLPGRVANVLLSYAERFGQPSKAGVAIDAPLSKEKLARHVGSIRRSVIRVLRTFEEQKVLDAKGAGIVVRSTEGLRSATLPSRLGIGHRIARAPGVFAPKDRVK